MLVKYLEDRGTDNNFFEKEKYFPYIVWPNRRFYPCESPPAS